jgi:hypothetical protein
MDKQFTTLTSSYYDNYLQYKVTGNPSYQNSYMSAEEGIQSILSSLQDQINTQNQQITDFYSSDVEGRLRDMNLQIRSTQKNLFKDTDQAVAASMRTQPTSPSFQVPTSYLISIGVLTATAFLLSVL